MGKVYREKSFYGTVFTKYKPEYFLGHKRILERAPIDKNIDEYIQSQRETLFERMLDEISSGGIVVDENQQMINESVRHLTNLDLMLETDEIFEAYRKENNLPEDVSKAEMYDMIRNKVGTLRDSFNKEKKINEETNKTSQESE